MLKTLDTYIDERSSVRLKIGRDRRFTLLLAVSVVVHVIFYTALIKLDSLAMQRAIASGRRQPSLVTLIDLAPPPDRATMRTAPEPVERADLNRLQFDPATADDVHLVPRSPKPSTQKGNAGRLPSADQLERQLRASRGSGGRDRTAPTAHQPALPQTSSIQANRIPLLDEAKLAQTPPTQSVPSPPTPAPKQEVSPTNIAGSEAIAAGVRRGSRSESAALGLEAAQGQYMALVRAKIRRANERNMPREWIKDILRDKVSADFLLIIKRDGQILNARLARSTGYSLLDDYARQAIYLASPFEGFPQAAGDALTFTVTVYFFTL